MFLPRIVATVATASGILVLATVSFSPPPFAQSSPDARRVIAIDPGHGGSESGAVYARTGGSAQLAEKDVNLAIVLFLAEDLRGDGFDVVLTRSGDTRVNEPPTDRNGDGRIDDDDLQAHVDVANDAQASLLLSIHNNGSPSPRTRGTSTWYAAAHPLCAQSRAMVEIAQAELLIALRSAGYNDPVDQGANDDPPLQKPYGHLFLVGPATPRVARPSQMPGIVGESLYVTSEVESQLLGAEAIQRAIAGGYMRAIERYFTERS